MPYKMKMYRGRPECGYCRYDIGVGRLVLVEVLGDMRPVHDTCEKDYRTHNKPRIEWDAAHPGRDKRGRRVKKDLEELMAEAGR